jgi:hypothetical protein
LLRLGLLVRDPAQDLDDDDRTIPSDGQLRSLQQEILELLDIDLDQGIWRLVSSARISS